MQALRGIPHSKTRETPGLLMVEQELRIHDQLLLHLAPSESQPRHEYVQTMLQRLEEAHDLLRQQQLDNRQEDAEEPPLFGVGDLVLLEKCRRKKGDNSKFQSKFIGPCELNESYPNHTYKIKRQAQSSIQNECRLKLYHPCPEVGQGLAQHKGSCQKGTPESWEAA